MTLLTTLGRAGGCLPFALAGLAAALPSYAWACSTCKCGDYTITLLGSEKPYAGRLVAAIDYLLRSESAGEGLEKQDTDEQRLTLGLAYSFNQDWTLAVQVPFVHKEISSLDLSRQEAEGLGDIDLTARWVAFRSADGVSGRHLAGLRGGVRLPTADQVHDHGELLDIDVQPDAGATAPNLGAWYAFFSYPWFASASATYFHYTEGHQNFHGGDVGLVSVLGQYALTQTLALQLGVDARQAGKNEFSGVPDPDSGGFLAMGSAGLVWRIGDDLVLSGGGQVELVEHLNGTQQEDPTLRLGISYDFGG